MADMSDAMIACQSALPWRSASRSAGRRQFMGALGALGAAVTVGPLIAPRYARAAQHTLRILQWNHLVPAYDQWFDNVYVKRWGEENDTEVIVDHVGVTALNSRAAAEVSAQKGHDLFMFLAPAPAYEEQVIDHREIYGECERKYGKPVELAVRSTYNPKTKKYFGFSDSYAPDPISYRKDLWDEIGMTPGTWDDVRRGGAKIKLKHAIPVGIGLSSELDTAMAVRSILYAFGGAVQDPEGNVVLNSHHTLEAVRFMKALYQEAMTPQVLAWDPSSNNRTMIAGQVSLALNAISIAREAENKNLPIADQIVLAKAAAGPAQRIGLGHVMNNYVIWKFARNKEGAKKFLVDYVGNLREGFLASQFYNFPCFPNAVSDLTQQLIARDGKATPPDKYGVLTDVLHWTTNVGYPGYANAAVDEVFNTWVLNTMFAKAATSSDTPQSAIKQAEEQCKRIFTKWRDRGLI